jgi:hypothetical protein
MMETVPGSIESNPKLSLTIVQHGRIHANKYAKTVLSMWFLNMLAVKRA